VQRPDHGNQRCRHVALVQNRVCAAVIHLLAYRVVHRKRGHGQYFDCGLASLEPLRGFESIDPRHHKIHHDDIGLLLKSQRNTGLALLRFTDHGDVVLQLKTKPEQPSVIRVVVNHNHTDGMGGLPNCLGQLPWTQLGTSIVCAMRRDSSFQAFTVGQSGVEALPV
jgi:hypothetical protein